MPVSIDPSSLQNALRARAVRARQSALRGVRLFAERVIAAAVPLCPRAPATDPHSGDLADSATIEAATMSGGIATCAFGFTASYAVWVHENLSAHHAVGQAKFLESPLRQMAGQLPEACA